MCKQQQTATAASGVVYEVPETRNRGGNNLQRGLLHSAGGATFVAK